MNRIIDSGKAEDRVEGGSDDAQSANRSVNARCMWGAVCRLPGSSMTELHLPIRRNQEVSRIPRCYRCKTVGGIFELEG